MWLPLFELSFIALPFLLPIVYAHESYFPSRITPESRLESRSPNASFVTAVGTNFSVDGQPFEFLGTDAYWLPMLNSTDNIRTTLQSIKDTNLSVVRIWGFNDVVDVPPNNGTFFQLFNPNGSITLNNGPTGLQRLDNVISVAQDLGLKILITTTNNWNPANSTSNTRIGNSTTLSKFSHGFLSNDYGGMDLYVSQFSGIQGTHDQFYTSETIRNAYKSYLNALVSRYADNPTIFGWEIANDPRCNSSVPASSNCTTTTVTSWHSDIAQYISDLDPNHLIGSGAQGFQCMPDLANCPKSFPLTHSKPPRQLSTSIVKRQTPLPVDPTPLDGSFGVDSQDILSIPQIGFSTFQLIPDQNIYGTSDPRLNASQNALEIGLNWIITQALASQQVGKPSLLTAFGLVSQNNSAFFVPFNSSQPFNSTSSKAPPDKRELVIGLSDQEQSSIYEQWITSAIESGINGVFQYQWSQRNLNLSGSGGVVTNTGGVLVTPNDGYGSLSGHPLANPSSLPPSPSLSPLASPIHKLNHTSAIAGGAVGGCFLVGLVVYLVVVVMRRRRRPRGAIDFLSDPFVTERAKAPENSSSNPVSRRQAQQSGPTATANALESSMTIGTPPFASHGLTSSADRDQPTTASNNMAPSLPVLAQPTRIQHGGSTRKSNSTPNLVTADTSSTSNPLTEPGRHSEEEITRLRDQNAALALNPQALPNSESSLVLREVAHLRAQMEQLVNRIGQNDDEPPPTYSSV